MVEWHNEGLTPEDIQNIIRAGRNKDDNTTFNDYGDYINYINKDNERIINEYLDHDHSKCEPNETTKSAFQEVLDELRKDREERDNRIYNLAIQSIEKNKPILDALGSDYDENGVPYWEKWTSKKIGDEFEKEVLEDLEILGFDFIYRNVYIFKTGCEVDFVAKKSDGTTWHVEAKGGKEGEGKRPGAKRTDNVKKAVANAALIKSVYPETYFVAYFSSRPKMGSSSREMIDAAKRARFFDEVRYLTMDLEG